MNVEMGFREFVVKYAIPRITIFVRLLFNLYSALKLLHQIRNFGLHIDWLSQLRINFESRMLLLTLVSISAPFPETT